jgi:hypothetical protein
MNLIMRKAGGIFLIVFFFTVNILHADEGMWMLPLINELNMSEMRNMGIQISAEDIYDINNSSIKDAVVIFDGGCTGEIVSDDGLLFTNHHCGYSQIQEHSTVEHDYLEDGYWAMSRGEELSNPGLEVRFLDSIANVSEQIFSILSDSMTEAERNSKIDEIIGAIEDSASEKGRYEAVVESFYQGNQYYLFTYTVYKDVRFVGAPPSSIGKFGYDTDNWQWPRHTGDFSIFRVYTAPDGSPAEYAEENIPLKPKHFLPVSLKGVEKGDFTFVMGYPGSTSRYQSSYGISETMNITNTSRIRIRGVRQEILMEDMMNDPRVNIQYASKYSRSSNYWKYSIGQNKGIRALKVLDKKRQEEAAFQQWADSDSSRAARYGQVLDELEQTYAVNKSAMLNLNVLVESFFSATEIIDLMADFQYLHVMLQSSDTNQTEIAEEIETLKDRAEKFYKDYNISTDIKVAKAMFRLYSELVTPDRYPSVYKEIRKKYKGDIDKFVDDMYAKTFFTDKDKTMAFLEHPSVKALQKDMAFRVGNSIFMKYVEEYNNIDELKLSKQERLYMEGRMLKEPERVLYPDANFTMRLSYGVVDNYSPGDAVHYDEVTDIKGIMEKEDTTNFEFIVPEKLKDLYARKDYGIYGQEDKMPVCFITNNDITGGNSGSPVMNDRGELIGLAFDGNLEAMSGDIAFEPAIQRCICVDIRYILFIIDKYAGASHLIDELKLVN